MLFLLLIIALTLHGCTGSIHKYGVQRKIIENENIQDSKNLKGLYKQDVIQLLGAPSCKGISTNTWYYISCRSKKYPMKTEILSSKTIKITFSDTGVVEKVEKIEVSHLAKDKRMQIK